MIDNIPVHITQTTEYPWNETVDIQLDVDQPCQFELALRIPAWCHDFTVSINEQAIEISKNHGYVVLDRMWTSETIIRLNLPMPIERIRANPKVRQTAGQVALQREPIVYCLEEVDNGANLSAIAIPKSTELTPTFEN